MQTSKRQIMFIALVSMLLLLSVGQSFAQDDVVTIRVMTFFAFDNPEVEQAVVDAFEEAHPNIDVILEHESYDNIFTKFIIISSL